MIAAALKGESSDIIFIIYSSSPGFLQDLLIQLLLESSSGSEDETGHVETWTRPGLLLLYCYHDDIIL